MQLFTDAFYRQPLAGSLKMRIVFVANAQTEVVLASSIYMSVITPNCLHYFLEYKERQEYRSTVHHSCDRLCASDSNRWIIKYTKTVWLGRLPSDVHEMFGCNWSRLTQTRNKVLSLTSEIFVSEIATMKVQKGAICI